MHYCSGNYVVCRQLVFFIGTEETELLKEVETILKQLVNIQFIYGK